jgi:hypothetical protein
MLCNTSEISLRQSIFGSLFAKYDNAFTQIFGSLSLYNKVNITYIVYYILDVPIFLASFEDQIVLVVLHMKFDNIAVHLQLLVQIQQTAFEVVHLTQNEGLTFVVFRLQEDLA